MDSNTSNCVQIAAAKQAHFCRVCRLFWQAAAEGDV